MNPREWLSHTLLLPIGMSVNGVNYFKTNHYTKFLQANEYSDIVALTEFRNQRFKKLMQHCYQQVPFYRQYLNTSGLQVKDFETIYDIVKLPIIDKQLLNQHPELLLAENYKPGDFRFDYTGGSTGTPTRFGIDMKNYYQVYANAWRFWGYAGYKPGVKMLQFWGNRIELSIFNYIKHKLRSFIENTIILNSYDFYNEERVIEYTERIRRYQPDIIRGYAGAVYLFVLYCKKYQLQFQQSPKAIILTSEKIFKSQKEEIARFFNCEVFEEYGSTEFGIIGHECESHSGFHLADEFFIVEVYNHPEQTSNFTGKGELLISCLYNYAMPLLRYRIEDEATISACSCPCGRTLGLLENIDGRIIDYIVTRREKMVHLIIFYNILSKIKGIKFFQIHQYEKGKIFIKIIKNENYDVKSIDKIAGVFESIFKDDLIIDFQYVDQLEVSASGKHKIILSEISAQYLPNYSSMVNQT